MGRWKPLACILLSCLPAAPALAQLRVENTPSTDFQQTIGSLEMTVMSRLMQARAEGNREELNDCMRMYKSLFEIYNGLEGSLSEDDYIRQRGRQQMTQAEQTLEKLAQSSQILGPEGHQKLETLHRLLQPKTPLRVSATNPTAESQRMLENLEKLHHYGPTPIQDPEVARLRAATDQLIQYRNEAHQLPQETRRQALLRLSHSEESLRKQRIAAFQTHYQIALWTTPLNGPAD